MKIFIDGRQVLASDIKFIYDLEDEKTMHLKVSPEGIVVDLVESDGQVMETGWQTLEDLMDITH